MCVCVSVFIDLSLISVRILSVYILRPSVIDLLAALNMTQPIKGVSRTHGEDPGTLVYKLRPRAPHLSLPHQQSHLLLSVLQGGMGVHLVARQALHSSSSLLSLSSSSSSSSPILQIQSSTLNNTLRLDYSEGKGAQGLGSLLFPAGNPFSGGDWVQLALGLEPDRLALFVDCQEAVAIHRKGEERLNMHLPQDLVITLASTPGESDSKFVVSGPHLLALSPSLSHVLLLPRDT